MNFREYQEHSKIIDEYLKPYVDLFLVYFLEEWRKGNSIKDSVEYAGYRISLINK